MAKKESFTVRGKELVQAVQDLFKRNDVGKICITYEEDKVFEITLLAGDPSSPASVIKEPILAVLNALGTLAAECTLEVERLEKDEVKANTKT